MEYADFSEEDFFYDGQLAEFSEIAAKHLKSLGVRLRVYQWQEFEAM